MKMETRLGLGLGCLIAVMSIVGNIARADRNIVSPFPDLLTIVVAVTLLLVGLEVNRRKLARGADERWSGFRAVTVAGGVFAILLAGFAALWLTRVELLLELFVLAGTFLSVALIGYVLVWVRAARPT